MKLIYLNNPTNISNMKGVCTTLIKKPGGTHPTRINNYSWPGDRLSYINFRWQENSNKTLNSNYAPTYILDNYYPTNETINMRPVSSNKSDMFKDYINQKYIYTVNNKVRAIQRVYEKPNFSEKDLIEDLSDGNGTILSDIRKLMVRKDQIASASGTPIEFLGMQIKVLFDKNNCQVVSDSIEYSILADGLFKGASLVKLLFTGTGTNSKDWWDSNAPSATTVKLLASSTRTVISEFTLPKGDRLTTLIINITPIINKDNISNNSYYRKMHVDFSALFLYENTKVFHTSSDVDNTLDAMFYGHSSGDANVIAPMDYVYMWFFSIAQKED